MKSKRVGVIALLIMLLTLSGYSMLHFNKDEKGSIQPLIGAEPLIALPSQDVDYTAQFSIKTHGIKRVFTSSMYHNLSQDVYIEARDPNIIRVKKSGITWNDFFSTLPFRLTENCLTTGDGETYCTGPNGSLEFYLNGERDDRLLEKRIEPNDYFEVTFSN